MLPGHQRLVWMLSCLLVLLQRDGKRRGPAAVMQACALLHPDSPELLCGPSPISVGCLPLDESEVEGSVGGCGLLLGTYNRGTISGEFLNPRRPELSAYPRVPLKIPSEPYKLSGSSPHI